MAVDILECSMMKCCSARRVLENKQNTDDDRIEHLAQQLKESQAISSEAEKKYEEVLQSLSSLPYLGFFFSFYMSSFFMQL